MERNRFFCGIKHCGKTTLARLVADMLGITSIDNDDLVKARLPEGFTVRSYYAAFGKRAFMRLEASALSDFFENDWERTPRIFSLGGGACDNPSLWTTVHDHGIGIYLKVPQAVLLQRILADGIPPFLDERDVEGSFSRLYAERDQRYGRLCDSVVELPDYPDVGDTAAFLVARL